MKIEVTGTEPNTVVRLEPETAAEALQIREVKLQAEGTRANVMLKSGGVLLLRVENLPKPNIPAPATPLRHVAAPDPAQLDGPDSWKFGERR